MILFSMSHSRYLICLLAAACLLSGCVRRRLTVRSSPPGATVYIDDQEVGTTPVSTPFVYYGTRKLQLVKDGYETQTIKHKVSAPWYQLPPLDFVSENLVPREIRDERIVDVELEPQRVVPVPELMSRAEELRRNSQTNWGAPAGYSTPHQPGAVGADFPYGQPSSGPPPYTPPSDPSYDVVPGATQNIPQPFYPPTP